MNKAALFLVFLLLIGSFSLVSAAGTEHGINGYIADAEEVSANGAIVVFYIESRPNERLTDIVGSQGNSLQDNWYAIDIKNFETPWQAGETLKIMIIKDDCKTAVTTVALSALVNNQQAPDLKLKECGSCPECCVCGSLLGVCWYAWLVIGIILAVAVYIIVKKQIQKKKKLFDKQTKVAEKSKKK